MLAIGLLGGCAGWRDQGDTYYAPATGKRSKQEATYRFGTPSGDWRPLRKMDDVQVAWIDPGIVGVIELHAQCDEQGDSSLAQYTDHLRIDWSEWKVVSQEEAKLIGRTALHTTVDADLDGIKRRHELWVVKKNGCLFDLRYSADPARFDQGKAEFARVVSGFAFPV